jgi:hypothetical protein
MRVRSLASSLTFLSVLAFSGSALAQAKETKDEKAKEEKKDDTAAGDDKDDAAKPAEGTEATKAPVGKPADDEPKDPHDPREKQDKTYYFIGARWRQNYLPKFMLNLFVSGGPTKVWVPSFGLEGTMRRNGFDTTLYLTYADWSMDPFAFKGKDEAPNAWEVVESRLKLINMGVDLLWGSDINPSFTFQYGVTAGLSAVIGDLRRVQGYVPAGQDAENADNVQPCNGVRNPTSPQNYCGDENEHYPSGGNASNRDSWYTEPSWFNGGKKPNIYASFGPQIGVRFKPVKEFVARLQVGWDLFIGPFFGLNGSYGL